MDRSQSKYFHTAAKMDEALISLLNEKEFEYITVKEICARAGVNRSTFYLHYENTRDLLEEAAGSLIRQFAACFSVDTQSITDQFRNTPLENLNYISDQYLIPYLTFIRDNRTVFAIAVANSKYLGFDDVYQRLFRHIFHPILDRFRFPEIEQPYVMAFYLNGVHAIVTRWLQHDCREPIETICGILQKCILGKLQGQDFASAIE